MSFTLFIREEILGEENGKETLLSYRTNVISPTIAKLETKESVDFYIASFLAAAEDGFNKKFEPNEVTLIQTDDEKEIYTFKIPNMDSENSCFLARYTVLRVPAETGKTGVVIKDIHTDQCLLFGIFDCDHKDERLIELVLEQAKNTNDPVTYGLHYQSIYFALRVANATANKTISPFYRSNIIALFYPL